MSSKGDLCRARQRRSWASSHCSGSRRGARATRRSRGNRRHGHAARAESPGRADFDHRDHRRRSRDARHRLVERLSATVPNLNIIGGLAGPGHHLVHGSRHPASRDLYRRHLAGRHERSTDAAARGPRSRRSAARPAGHAVRPRLDRRRDPDRDEEAGATSSAARSARPSAILSRRDVTASIDLPIHGQAAQQMDGGES